MQMKKILLIGLLLSSISLSPVFQSKVFAQDGANANGGVTIGGSGGGGVALSGFAYDFVLGNGTSGHTVARGTIAASDPWIFTQTWNNAGVAFSGFNIDMTQTSAANGSCLMSLFRSSVFQGGFCDQGSSKFNFVSDELHLDTGNGNSSGVTLRHIGTNLLIFSGISGFTIEYYLGAATCVSGCGTSPTIAGNGSIGQITLGTAPNATTVVMGFGFTAPSAPYCTSAYNRTTNSLLTWVSTTSQVTFTGTFAAGNNIVWSCAGSR